MQTPNDPKRVLVDMEAPCSSHTHSKQQNRQFLRRCVANHTTCIFSTLLALTLVTSLVALGISIAALMASQQNGAEWARDDKELDATTLYQVEAMLEGMGEMTFEYTHDPVDEHVRLDNTAQPGNHYQRRNVDTDIESLCSSSNETGAKPLAHIIGPHTNVREAVPDEGSFVVLTKQWRCMSESGNQGMVQGGMTFHRSSGFLELPTSGVYYVYQQVVFGSRDRMARLARSQLVACIPGADCGYLGDPYMQTEANLEGRYGTSKSQGGLFHFLAGTQIAILVFNERFSSHNHNVTPITYDDSGHQTYMGAFLVDGDKQ